MELSRRDLMFALFGAGAAAACKTRPLRRTIDGEIAGANDSLGHKLRDGFAPPATEERRVPIVIVGGGIAGLSAGWRLLRAGITDFEVIELDEIPGGTARGGQNAVSKFPWGAHYLPAPLPHARAVIELLIEAGVAERDAGGSLIFDEAQLCRAPQERIFAGGRFSEGLYPRAGASTEDERQLAAFLSEARRWSDHRDAAGRRAFAVPASYGSRDEAVLALDGLSAKEWLDARGLSSPRLRWFVEYACRDDFGARLSQTSAWAMLHYFASRQTSGRSQELLTWPDGNAHLVAHLSKSISPRLRTGIAATRVEPRDGGAVVQTFEPRTGRAQALRADQVILAVPRAFAARLLRDQRTAAEAALFPTSAWLVCNLTLSRAPASHGFPQAWDNVLYDSPSLGYVVATHQQDLPPGRTVWTYYYPFADDDPAEGRRKLYQLTHAQIAEAVLSDLGRAHFDLADCVERLDAWRWGHAMVRPVPGLQRSPSRRAAALPRDHLHFAHTELSGMALFEEAQFHGIRAAEEILSARRVSFSSLLD